MNKFRRNPQIGTLPPGVRNRLENLKTLADAGVPIALGSGSGLRDTSRATSNTVNSNSWLTREWLRWMQSRQRPRFLPQSLASTILAFWLSGKKGSFIVFSSNPLDTITNSKDIDSVYMNGHLLDRLEMVRKIKVETVTVSTKSAMLMTRYGSAKLKKPRTPD